MAFGQFFLNYFFPLSFSVILTTRCDAVTLREDFIATSDSTRDKGTSRSLRDRITEFIEARVVATSGEGEDELYRFSIYRGLSTSAKHSSRMHLTVGILPAKDNNLHPCRRSSGRFALTSN